MTCVKRCVLVLVLVASCSFGRTSSAADPGPCDKGADLSADECRFFFLRRPLGQEHKDPRISQRLEDAGADIRLSRSYALVISNSKYPNFGEEKDRTLAAAKVDLDNLKQFLEDQSFDEIIVLENKDATRQNIDHFLGSYLSKQLDLRPKAARVLIAYTGHGAPGDTEHKIPGSLVLHEARDSGDSDHLYDLRDLNAKLEKLANKSFQFVALIGSCYSGGLFGPTAYSGGNDMFPGGRGAHAVSATQANDLAYGLSPTSGSVFFDTFIKAANNSWTDIDYAQLSVSPDGSRRPLGGGIIRLGMIVAALTSQLDQLGKVPGKDKKFPQPVFGSIKTDGASEGALFFLGPSAAKLAPTVATDTKVSTAEVLQTTGSAIVGHPELKVFSAPDTYRVYGVDVSHWEGVIDWKKVAANKRLKFTYIKATERRQDPTFSFNWAQAKEVGLRRGAFHVFSFCRSARTQFEIIKKYVPRTDDALPFALDVLWYGKPMDYESACTDKVEIRKNLVELMALCRSYFRKPVVLHTPAEFWADFSSVVTADTLVWLQDWKSSPLGGSGPNLPGAAPWTIWQFSRNSRIDGIKSGADVNAFFGSPAEFELFARGQSIALNSALGKS